MSIFTSSKMNYILDLHRTNRAIIDSDKEPTSIKQTSLAELHRLNITLSNYIDVLLILIINGRYIIRTIRN